MDRPVETRLHHRRIRVAWHIDREQRRERGERGEEQPANTCAKCRARRRAQHRPARSAGAHEALYQAERHERDADERHGGEFGGHRDTGREPKKSRVRSARRRQPALERIEREQRRRGGGHIQRRERRMPENGRHRHEQQHREQSRAGGAEQASCPQPRGQQQQHEKRQRAGAREQQKAFVVPAGVKDVLAFLGAIRRWRAERVCAGEVGSQSEQDPGERRMLGVVLVMPAVEELKTGRQMLRLIPGVAVDAPAARGEQARRENDEHQCAAHCHRGVRAAKTAQIRLRTGAAARWSARGPAPLRSCRSVR